ncbi:MAG: CoB--CoM heterodisulfide reductase iron-sulfur subunit B family protein [Candidatus Thermoplasmatota archaeon]|jgi:heterodisulfide reductase subunit B|nr:CoB--CoM heterodisulfide reductase iron-sulfur subunit B family protein [Candidatus Thermoplasmatota archaeon]
MKYALFLGCTVAVRSLNYEVSARNIAKKLGIELVDLSEFACCGYPLTQVDRITNFAMAARNLALAEKAGLDIMTLCPSCSSNLTKINIQLCNDLKTLSDVNKLLKDERLEYKGTIKVRHFTEVLYITVGPEKIKELVSRSLAPFKIAPHYSCHYMKPSIIHEHFEDPAHPVGMEKLIEATGATPVNYENKLQCCGAALLAVEEETPTAMTREKLDHMKAAGADAMIVDCPFCAVMYDEYQKSIGSEAAVEYNIPVLFISQMLGLAFGMDPNKELLINKNNVKMKKLLKKWG